MHFGFECSELLRASILFISAHPKPHDVGAPGPRATRRSKSICSSSSPPLLLFCTPFFPRRAGLGYLIWTGYHALLAAINRGVRRELTCVCAHP
jgi:hypothetical protein